MTSTTDLNHRAPVHEAIATYFDQVQPPKVFMPGESFIPVSGKVLDVEDLKYLTDACLDMWLTEGRFTLEFENNLVEFVGVKHALFVNSGSSANLLALSSLTSPKLGKRQLKPGDEIITLSAGFPTTVNAIIQNRLKPVFVDIRTGSYDVDPELIENALSKKTKGIMIAHTLGNPFDLESISDICKKNDLWLIEDCCDALGSKYGDKRVGSFGDIATFSFYPAHHITTGEGGAVLTSNAKLHSIIKSFRDWGRDCWCPTGVDNTCGKRFDWQLGKLPKSYDHKYIYSHIGYNLKATDMQAALGVSQLKKINRFILKRRSNYNRLYEGLEKYQEQLILPREQVNSEPSWFGFPVTLKENSGLKRAEIILALNNKKIATRLLFGGDLTAQPAYQGMDFRVSGHLNETQVVMNDTFWIGLYPGITEEMIDYTLESFDSILQK